MKTSIHWRQTNIDQLSTEQPTDVHDVIFSHTLRSYEKLDYFQSRFFWQQEKRKYRLVKWSILCQPKDQEGLDIQNLDIQNTAVHRMWLYKLLTTDGTWQELIRNKYLGSKPLS
jgi:hypothetical protein